MSSTTFKQDLPPEGGYRKLDFTRIPARQIWKWWAIIPAYCVSTGVGIYLYKATRREIFARNLENDAATIAIMPLIVAEKDRSYLRHLYKVREAETELMKNVKGWETGTLFGEPVYKTQPEDEFVPPRMNEFYVHNKEEDLKYRHSFFHYF